MYTYKIDVIRVIDGDTIDANIDLGFDISVKKRIRFLGINTPESRTRDKEEKKLGLAAKARVCELLDSADEVLLTSHGVGKFGRCLGEIDFSCPESFTMKNLNKQLIEEGHAVEYFGGKR
jgi:micrococcal nuclease